MFTCRYGTKLLILKRITTQQNKQILKNICDLEPERIYSWRWLWYVRRTSARHFYGLLWNEVLPLTSWLRLVRNVESRNHLLPGCHLTRWQTTGSYVNGHPFTHLLCNHSSLVNPGRLVYSRIFYVHFEQPLSMLVYPLLAKDNSSIEREVFSLF
jgi:hypothetical protein